MPIPRGFTIQGPSGVAVVRLYKTKVNIEFAEDGSQYSLPRDACPDFLKKGGKMYVELSSDGGRLRRVRPVDEVVTVGFLGFTRPEGSAIPVPQTKVREWRDKQTGTIRRRETLRFTAVMAILEEPWVGCRIYGPLEYRFRPKEVNGETVMGIPGRSARDYLRLIGFLEAAGLDFEVDDIPVSDNVLPGLEELLLERQRPFLCTLGDTGWPEEYSKLPKSRITKADIAELKRQLKAYQESREES